METTYTLELTDEELRKLVSLKKLFNFYKNKHESVNYELFKKRIYSGRYTIKRALETPRKFKRNSSNSLEYQKWQAVALENGISKEAFYRRTKKYPDIPFDVLVILPLSRNVKKWLQENGYDFDKKQLPEETAYCHEDKQDDTTIRTIKYYLEQGIPLNRKHRVYYEAHKEEFQ